MAVIVVEGDPAAVSLERATGNGNMNRGWYVFLIGSVAAVVVENVDEEFEELQSDIFNRS